MTSASPILLTRSASKRGLVPVAEGGEGGLIELRLDRGALGNTVAFIYKRLQRPAYVFTGMLVVLAAQSRYVWTVVSGERGMTGVREGTTDAQWVDEPASDKLWVDRAGARLIAWARSAC